MKTLKYFLYTFSFFTFIFVLPARAFEISPAKSLFTVNPGTSQTIVVKIKNTEKINLNFKLGVLGMIQDENGRPVFFGGVDAAESWVYPVKSGEAGLPAAEFNRVNPENNLIKIKSGETKSVNFIIRIPADAVSGSYYLGLTVEPVLEKNNSAGLSARLVSLLTLQVKGLVQESVAIEKWEPSASQLNDLENTKLKFDLNLKNNGTIEVQMNGKIAIRNWRGEEIFSEPIILGNKLLAGSKRVLHPEIILRPVSNDGTGHDSVESNKMSLPGLYSAQVKINYGRTNQTVSAIAYIWYFPQWNKAVLGLAALFFLVLVFWRVKKAKLSS